MSEFFIRRPIVAMVISIVMVIAGAVVASRLPVEQYPELAPPNITVSANYPGASAEVVEQAVATPIEQQVNGVDNMLSLKSTNTSDGRLNMQVQFEVGTDRDMANVLVQNRVSQANSRLPSDVIQQGVTVKKQNPSILMLVSIYSPDGTYDDQFLNNYTTLNVRDALLRVPGISQADLFGAEYGMRIWLRPDRLAELRLTPSDVVAAIREQNIQAPAGQIGGAPTPPGQEFTYTVRSPSRLSTAEEFGAVIVRSAGQGGEVRVRDVGRVELGSENYRMSGRLDGAPAAVVALYLLPGANQTEVAKGIYARLAELKPSFPAGIDYAVSYDTTPAVEASIHEVMKTLYEAVFLVILVVFLFLQSWRATLIPLLTVPVALVGTLAFFPLFGFSINVLTLFGLVLAIGIVVDDAIVVVEAVVHHMEHGLAPVEATRKAMQEVTGPVVGIALVLSAVFVPVAFVGGLTGRLYQQFAITIALSVLLSAFNALTLSPALAALLLKPGSMQTGGPLGRFFGAFNRAFDRVTGRYTTVVASLVRRSALAVILVAAFAGGTGVLAKFVPAGFVPDEDQGIFFIHLQLPGAASMERTAKVAERVEELIRQEPAVERFNTLLGTNILSGAAGPSVTSFAVKLKPWEERQDPSLHISAVMRRLQGSMREIPEAIAFAFAPPTIPGFGAAGGVSFVLQDKTGQRTPQELGLQARALAQAAAARPELAGLSSTFDPSVPQVAVAVDRERARAMGVPLPDIFTALQASMGGLYVNDFNRFGRVYRVFLQADAEFRRRPENLGDVSVRSQTTGAMVPLTALVTATPSNGTEETTRYNLFRSVSMNGGAAPGFSSGQAMSAISEVAASTLPADMGIEWTGFSYQEATAPPAAPTFILALVFVFLLLAALYESWSLPVSVLLGTPLAAFGAFLGLKLAGLDANVFTQIGLITLIGLAAKNAILIVEFAKMRREDGLAVADAAIDAAKLRFRPILMTSFAFILGVVPLVLASGSGAAGQNVIGTAVLAGMLAATVFGVFIIPGLYAFVQGLVERRGGGTVAGATGGSSPSARTAPGGH